MNQKSLIAEFIGTFALIFIGVGAIAADQMTGGKMGLTGIALAHGLTIAVMVSATGAISGGHLNPAVTVGLLTAGKIDGKNAIGYIVSQSLGAMAAAFMIAMIIPAETLAAVNWGTPIPRPGVGSFSILLTEIILTFFLVFVVYGTVIDRRAPKVGGLFIGLTVALDVLMGGPISGAAMNPARHFGPALFSGQLSQSWIYWLGPVIGGVLAAQLYKTQLEENN